MNVYEKYGVKKVINASGNMTVLGVSKVSDEVIEDINIGLKNFFVIDELFKKSNSYIAELLNVEGVCITSSASSGIAMSIAALIAGDDINACEYIHQLKTDKRNVLMLKGHNINYGGNIETMVNLGAGKIQEVGSANVSTIEHIRAAINDNTLCFLYVKSHHCVQKNQVSLEEIVKVCNEKHVPVIIDAAAEEDLQKYYMKGADLVVYSGAKAVEGPTSGLVLGKKELTDKVYFQYKGIGRAMKIGKEGILGLTRAIERYVNLESNYEMQCQLVDLIITNTNKNTMFKLEPVDDLAGRKIKRVLLITNPICASKIIGYLCSKEITIETRNHQVNLGKIELDVRQVTREEALFICKKLNEFIEMENNGINTKVL
ncbi:MAG: DgaE family pyridoxal phosphate-dependent ammonia lyase [Mycoplasmatales bacterium]